MEFIPRGGRPARVPELAPDGFFQGCEGELLALRSRLCSGLLLLRGKLRGVLLGLGLGLLGLRLRGRRFGGGRGDGGRSDDSERGGAGNEQTVHDYVLHCRLGLDEPASCLVGWLSRDG